MFTYEVAEPCPLAPANFLVFHEQVEFRTQVFSLKVFLHFEFVVRVWLSWQSGEHLLSTGHPRCSISDGYASAEAAGNISLIMAKDVATFLCAWAATAHSRTSNMQADRTHNPCIVGCRRHGKEVS